MQERLLKVDSSNRVCLAKAIKNYPQLARAKFFRVYIEGDKLILEPAQERDIEALEKEEGLQ